MEQREQKDQDREKLEREADLVQDTVDQQPGDRQRRNQNDEAEDPLAA